MKFKRPTLKDVRQAERDAYDRGRLTSLERMSKLEEQNKKLTIELEQARLQALTNICQAGSSVVESMARALLSFDHNL